MLVLRDGDREIVRKRLRGMQAPVTLLHATRETGCDSCADTLRLLRDLTALTDKLSLEVRHPRSFEGNERVPATRLIGARDHGVHYYGIPSGFEFPALVEDILMVSRGDSGLSAASRSRLARVRDPLLIQVFVTPTSPYCAGAVRLAHQFAMQNGRITAEMVETTGFPDLAARYGVTGVPLTVVNGKIAARGMLAESAFLARILEAIRDSSS